MVIEPAIEPAVEPYAPPLPPPLTDPWAELTAPLAALWTRADEAVVLADRAGRIRYANPAYHALFCLEADQPEAAYFDTLFREKTPALARQRYQSLYDLTPDTHRIETRLLWADGGECLLETALHFVRKRGVRVAAVATMRDVTGKRLIQERAQLEPTLVRNERKFRAVFNQTGQFTCVLDPTGTLLEANQTTLTQARLTQNEVANQPYWEAPWWHPATQPRLREMVAAAARGQNTHRELAWQCPDRTVLTVDLALTPCRDEEGRINLLLAEARDVTDRKRAETRLRTSEEKYKGAFVSAPAGLLLTDDRGRVIDANPAAERLLGLGKAHLLARHVADPAWRPLDANGHPLPADQLPAARALAQRQAITLDAVGMPQPDASVRWLHVSAVPVARTGGVVVACVDVSQTHRQRQDAQASEARYRLLFDTTRYAVLRLTPALAVTEANPEASQLFGYPANAWPTAFRLLSDADAPAGLAELACVGTLKGTFTLVGANGRSFVAEVTIRAVDADHREYCATLREKK